MPKSKRQKVGLLSCLITISREDTDPPIFFLVSLTKVSKKTKEHKNAMMNEVCEIDQFIYLVLTIRSTAPGQLGKMEILLAF